jgi:hypothetical protein
MSVVTIDATNAKTVVSRAVPNSHSSASLQPPKLTPPLFPQSAPPKGRNARPVRNREGSALMELNVASWREDGRRSSGGGGGLESGRVRRAQTVMQGETHGTTQYQEKDGEMHRKGRARGRSRMRAGYRIDQSNICNSRRDTSNNQVYKAIRRVCIQNDLIRQSVGTRIASFKVHSIRSSLPAPSPSPPPTQD